MHLGKQRKRMSRGPVMRFESRFSWIALALPLLCNGCAQEDYPQAEWNARNRGWIDASAPEVSSRDVDVPEVGSLDVADVSAPPLDVSIDSPAPTVDAGAIDVSVPETS